MNLRQFSLILHKNMLCPSLELSHQESSNKVFQDRLYVCTSMFSNILTRRNSYYDFLFASFPEKSSSFKKFLFVEEQILSSKT